MTFPNTSNLALVEIDALTPIPTSPEFEIKKTVVSVGSSVTTNAFPEPSWVIVTALLAELSITEILVLDIVPMKLLAVMSPLELRTTMVEGVAGIAVVSPFNRFAFRFETSVFDAITSGEVPEETWEVICPEVVSAVSVPSWVILLWALDEILFALTVSTVIALLAYRVTIVFATGD